MKLLAQWKQGLTPVATLTLFPDPCLLPHLYSTMHQLAPPFSHHSPNPTPRPPTQTLTHKHASELEHDVLDYFGSREAQEHDALCEHDRHVQGKEHGDSFNL